MEVFFQIWKKTSNFYNFNKNHNWKFFGQIWKKYSNFFYQISKKLVIFFQIWKKYSNFYKIMFFSKFGKSGQLLDFSKFGNFVFKISKNVFLEIFWYFSIFSKFGKKLPTTVFRSVFSKFGKKMPKKNV